MTNPFEKRATEYLRDDAAFLSVVTPEPLHTFFEKYANDGSLFDRLCMVIGTPGSGKTTIAMLMKLRTVHTLINSPNHTEYRPLQNALMSCKIIENERPKVLACRIPLESEYRDFWELPYNENIKIGLLKSFLQSRTVISWLKSLRDTKQFVLDETTVVYREDAVVAKDSIGGTNAEEVLIKAKEIERIIYEISATLVPPHEDKLNAASIAPYHPFDSIEAIIVRDHKLQEDIQLQPLVILDDVHTLHPKQLFHMQDWLSKREMRISRWMLMRLDSQTPESVLLEGVASYNGIDSKKTIKKSREITYIWLQSKEDRGDYRRKFRTMARNMADKYLHLMPVFNMHSLVHFQDLLNTQPTQISGTNLTKLRKKIDNFQKRANIGHDIRKSLESEIERYNSGSNQIIEEDVKLAMLHILLHRYVKRVPQSSLFDIVENEDSPEPSRPLKADSSIVDGARVFLLHEFNRPYYYGIDAVCDGSSENAEQFLQLAGRLVNASEARIIRGSPSSLSSSYQHQLLKEKADEIIREWAFPKHQEVKRICSFIADQCLKKSLEPNIPLGGGANAFGILQKEFEDISTKQPELARILKFGVAYNALSIKPRHKTKNRIWVLIELTGPFLINKGLTFARGGFLERHVTDLLIPL